MERYDYYEAVKADILRYLKENYESKRVDRDELYDELWVADSVTGNASGSYTFSTWQAEENLCHNLDLLVEARMEFGGDIDTCISNGAEYCDVVIRCYLLSQCLNEVLNENDFEDDENDDDDE